MNQQSNHYKYQPIYPPWFDKSLENPQTKQKCIVFSHCFVRTLNFLPSPQIYTVVAVLVPAVYTHPAQQQYHNKMNQQSNHYKYWTHLPPLIW